MIFTVFFVFGSFFVLPVSNDIVAIATPFGVTFNANVICGASPIAAPSSDAPFIVNVLYGFALLV